MARPKKKIPRYELKRYMLRGHTQAEACAHFGVTDKTLREFIKREYRVNNYKQYIFFLKAGVI